jgi:hypothetical protein
MTLYRTNPAERANRAKTAATALVDFDRINRAALATFLVVLTRLLPGGKVAGREFLALNPTRSDHRQGSFKINLRSGRWSDFATGDSGGDPVSLCAYLEGVSQGEAARLLARMLGFVYGLSRAAQLASRFAGVHRQPNPMAEKPSGFHAAFEHPLNLSGRNAFLAGAHQMDDLQPKMQRQMRILENRPHANREGLFAGVALAQARARSIAVQAANLRGFTAMRTNRTFRPLRGFDISEGSRFGLKVRRKERTWP